MRTNGICMAENSAKGFLRRGIFHKVKHRFAPYLLAGGMLLAGSNCLKGQELKTDIIDIGKEQQTELAEQTERAEKCAKWLGTSLALLAVFGACVMANDFNKHANPEDYKDEEYIDFY